MYWKADQKIKRCFVDFGNKWSMHVGKRILLPEGVCFLCLFATVRVVVVVGSSIVVALFCRLRNYRDIH